MRTGSSVLPAAAIFAAFQASSSVSISTANLRLVRGDIVILTRIRLQVVQLPIRISKYYLRTSRYKYILARQPDLRGNCQVDSSPNTR